MRKLVVVGAVILLFFVLFSDNIHADDWHSFHRDIKNTGVAESEGPPTNFTSWKVYLPTYGAGSMSYENGVIFLPSGHDGLRAVNATTGGVLWTTLASGSVYSTPTYQDGRLYFGAIWGNGTFYAIDASDGSILWTQIIGEEYTGSPVVAEDLVFVPLVIRGIVALNINNGSVVWNNSLGFAPGYMHSTPAYEDGILYCGGDRLYALNSTDGSIIWESPAGGSESGIVIVDDKVCGHGEKYVTCVNKTTGNLSWKTRVTNNSPWSALESTPAVFGDRLFVGTQDGKAFALSLQNGSEIWNVTLGERNNGSILSSPIVAPNNVVYFMNDYLWALNATTGELIWSLGVRESYTARATPILVNGIIYYHDVVYLVAVGDLLPPEVSGITLNGQSTLVAKPGETVRIEAWVSDAQTGGHDVVEASFTTKPFFGESRDFVPEDGAFDSPSERVYFDLDTTGMDDGAYGLEFWTCDSLVNCGRNTTGVDYLIIDGSPPDIEGLGASPGEFVLGESTNITWNVSDAYTVETNRIEILDGNGTVVHEEQKEGDCPYIVTFVPTWHGEHTVRVVAIDSAGNVAEQTITFEVFEPQRPGDQVEDYLAIWVVMVLVLVALLVVVLVFLWHKRKKEPDGTKEEPPQ
jgi:outer membrane protein assembly factor BamB